MFGADDEVCPAETNNATDRPVIGQRASQGLANSNLDELSPLLSPESHTQSRLGLGLGHNGWPRVHPEAQGHVETIRSAWSPSIRLIVYTKISRPHARTLRLRLTLGYPDVRVGLVSAHPSPGPGDEEEIP